MQLFEGDDEGRGETALNQTSSVGWAGEPYRWLIEGKECSLIYEGARREALASIILVTASTAENTMILRKSTHRRSCRGNASMVALQGAGSRFCHSGLRGQKTFYAAIRLRPTKYVMILFAQTPYWMLYQSSL